jgi:hypothetical protein
MPPLRPCGGLPRPIQCEVHHGGGALPDDDAVPFLAQEPGDPDAKSMDADRCVGESVAA